MSFKPGQIIIHRETNQGSFYMVMSVGTTWIKKIAVFGNESLNANDYKYDKAYVELYYKEYDPSKSMAPVVLARLDHEIMRRFNKVYENNTPSDVYGHRSSSSKKKHLLSRKRRLHLSKR